MHTRAKSYSPIRNKVYASKLKEELDLKLRLQQKYKQLKQKENGNITNKGKGYNPSDNS